MRVPYRSAVVPALFAVAACVPQAAPPPVPAPAPSPVRQEAPPPVVAMGSDWRDWPLTPGDWTWRRDAGGSIATFGRAGATPALALRCEGGTRRMTLTRAGDVAAPLTIRTTSTTRTLAVQPTGAVPPSVAVALAADDRLLDAMAFSRGRVVIQQPGGGTLVVPAWAEIGRVVEDCRG